MIEICKPADCTGCSACYSSCPVHAISMESDAKGFLYPVIDQILCIDCGLCQHVCLVKNESQLSNPKQVFAAWAKNTKDRRKSTSGGVFYQLAVRCIQSNGVVFGAVWANDWSVEHVFADTIEKLSPMRSSKYVQSEIGETFKQAKSFLDEGLNVLFSGTPCQIAGLKNYLGKDYPSLLTVDIVCHGTPPAAVFQLYISQLEKIMNDKVVFVNLRDKRLGWTKICVVIGFKNERPYVNLSTKDFFFLNFNHCLYLRESCHQCLFATENRVSDITLCDFWGYKSKSFKMARYEKGLSGVLLNSNRGIKAFENINNKLKFEARTLQDLKPGNLCLTRSFDKNNGSDTFWSAFQHGTYEFFPLGKITEITNKLTLMDKIKKVARQYRFIFKR